MLNTCPVCGYETVLSVCPLCRTKLSLKEPLGSSNPEEILYWKLTFRRPPKIEWSQLHFTRDRHRAMVWKKMLEERGLEVRPPMPVFAKHSRNPEEIAMEVRPETVARWREWGVPEDVIQKAIRQRRHVLELRRTEEMVKVEGFAYPMPRLPEVEAEPWGTAKAIDFEGTISARFPFVADKIKKIDRWLYRWEYYRPRITIKTRTYELTEEIANMWHTMVTIRYVWDVRLGRYALDYETHAASARAVRICLIIEPYLTHPEKKRRATQILQIYRERPSIPRPKPI